MAQTIGILMYHAVVRSPLAVGDWCFLDEASFRSQVKHLKTYCEVIPLSHAVTRLGAPHSGRPTVAITLDDGFENNHEVAFPILREAGLPATIFLTTGLIGTDGTVWFCRLNRALTRTGEQVLEWREHRFELCDAAAKATTSAALQALLKEFPQPQLEVQLRHIIQRLGDDADAPMEADSPFRMLSRAAIEAMAATGLIEFGAHTRTHAILSRLSPEEQQSEIEQSLATVREITKRPCTLFAFPNGRREDYDQASLNILERGGVDTAVTAIDGLNDGSANALELKRSGIGTDSDWSEFLRLLHGAVEPA